MISASRQYTGVRSLIRLCLPKSGIYVSIQAVLVGVPSAALADGVPTYNYATPIFGLAVAPDGSLLVADRDSGIVELRNGSGSLVAALPGVVDVAPIGRGDMFALTGGAHPRHLAGFSGYRVQRVLKLLT